MPCRTLRFCPSCVTTQHTACREQCQACGDGLRPLLDAQGALSRAFLTARGHCCENGCRNCPYADGSTSADAATIPVAQTERKMCERCGANFECQSAGCWCERVALSPATLKWLGRTYVDCLCGACLSDFTIA